MIPESLTQRLATRPVPVPRANHELRPGDLRRGSSGGVERLLLVLKRNSAESTVQVTGPLLVWLTGVADLSTVTVGREEETTVDEAKPLYLY